jgi:signal transduction histidine kinase
MTQKEQPMQDQSAASNGREATEKEMNVGELVARFDWARTPLGPGSEWPDSLKAPVRILLTSGFPMWMAWGPELTMLYNDGYAQTTLGKKHPWALGRPVSEVWHEIWNDIGPLVHRVMETEEACWEEKLPLTLERNGYPEETYHTFSYSPLAGPDGRVSGLLCVVIEDTVRVLGERQLGALSKLAAELAGAITQEDVYAGIERGVDGEKDLPCTLTYLFDDTGKELRLVAKTGFEADHPAACLIMNIDSKPAPWPIHELLESNRAITVENLSIYFPDLPPGCWDQPPSRARLVPIARTGQEKPAGVFITALNPYRQLDASYAGFLDLVAGQIAASITNARAYDEERKRAEGLAELDRAKTTFFSNVSHELRTPLTLILGPIEDALTGQTAPSAESMEMLHRNALRLLKLVNGLLDFVRIEVGRLRATYEATDLSQLTAQLASVFRSAMERAGLKLIVDCPPLPEPVYVDREMWEKIVLNLLSNALKSTFEGEIRVTLQSTGTGAQLSVTDTGTGISKDELPHLFQRFRRIEGAPRRSHEGSGIGLALVQELVEMHGGSIRAESVLGEGSTFSVTLPFGHAHLSRGQVVTDRGNSFALQGSALAYVQEAMGWLPGRDRLKGEVTPAGEGPQGTSEPETAEEKPVILVVDDNADMREYLISLLGWRFKIVSAANGRRAMEQVERERPDLILTDMMMPELDGFGLLAALRNDPATQTIPVILLSARAGEESRIEGIGAGADDYLTKPFSARELVARVEAQLKMARLRRDAVEQEAALNRELNRTRQFAWEALEHIPEVFYIFDKEFRFTYINAAGAEIEARLGKPLMGEVLWELLPELVGTIVETCFRKAMEERTPEEFEYYYEPLDTWFQYRVYPLPDEGIIMYAQNTTEKRKSEQALRRSEQLGAAGRLAASIAHEINNPLEAVTNLLFLAKMDQAMPSNSRTLLEMADKELQRLSHIAARSLKFYRQRTAPTSTSMEELLESVIFFHETTIKSRSIDLDRRYRKAPLVFCYPGEVQQVVTNLLGNALDAVEPRGRMVVGVRPAHDRGGREGVVVTVADNGCGMSEDMLERLFQPFATTKGEEGTGLGLWVSKGILDKHRARIAVRSKQGYGTVFRFFIPVNAAAEPEKV